MEITKNISYLHARDPSILAWGGAHLQNVKCDLKNLMDTVVESEEDEVKQVQVFLRLKKGDLLDLYEINDNTLSCKVPENSANAKHIRYGDQIIRKYKFSKIFPPASKQKEIFDYVVKPRVLNFINGHSATLLTYGASGAGKTFTIVGTTSEPGLVPRVLEYLFKSLPQMPGQPVVKPKDNGGFKWLSDVESEQETRNLQNLLNISAVAAERSTLTNTYRAMQKRLSNEAAAEIDENNTISLGIWVSFAEVYNEHVYDLLEWNTTTGASRPKLKICNNQGSTYIKSLKDIYVSSGMEAFQLLQCGLHNLNYAATAINSHSSRSHSIFTIKLVHAYSKDEVRMSHFNFCDLAGSERSKKTLNVGDRLKESNNINTSLLVLGKCISILRNTQKSNDNKKLIPFRESKLTQLFQKALTGAEDILMIVNVNPIKEMFDESLHALNFSAIAKDIKIECNKVADNKRKQDSVRIEDLLAENEQLRITQNDLYNLLETREEEFERIEAELRRELTRNFMDHMEQVNKQHKLKLEEAFRVQEDLQRQINEIRCKRPRYDESIICLDDSSSQVSSEANDSSSSVEETFVI